MSDNLLHDDGEITTTDITPGWVAQLHNGDGSCTEYWAPTEDRARAKAEADR